MSPRTPARPTRRSALAAIEWPDDELAVFATLLGSLFAIDDETLFDYHHQLGRAHPFRIPDTVRSSEQRTAELDRFLPVTDALELLQVLHRRRNDVPVTDTIGHLLEATRAHAGFVMRPAGEQALANVLQIAEMARRYESGRGLSFRGFVERLQEEAEARQASDAPTLEEGSDGVRIMTVHRAKGLEFPVVILADPTCKLHRQTTDRYIDAARGLCALRLAGWQPLDLLDHKDEEVARDRAEGVRLAYVAATRARDLLVVPAVGDGPREGGWTSPLHAALYPPVSMRRSPDIAPRSPTFGGDSVLDRPYGDPAQPDTVAPGLYRFDVEPGVDAGTGGERRGHVVEFPAGRARTAPDPAPPSERYSVIWWDPKTLRLDVEVHFGIRQEELLSKETPDALIEEDLHRYRAWRSSREQTLTHAGTPSVVVERATDRAARLVNEEQADRAPGGDVDVIELPHDPDRPSGKRFGSLVHAVLATVPFEPDVAGINEIATLHGRILGATDEEVTSAAAAARAVMRHPVFKRARAAFTRGECLREVPVTLRDDDDTLVEGVVDLAVHGGRSLDRGRLQDRPGVGCGTRRLSPAGCPLRRDGWRGHGPARVASLDAGLVHPKDPTTGLLDWESGPTDVLALAIWRGRAVWSIRGWYRPINSSSSTTGSVREPWPMCSRLAVVHRRLAWARPSLRIV